jgi:hypothetical protein
MCSASPRTKDMQRTPKIEITRTDVLGSKMYVAHGIARKSKAKAKKQMRPLYWRTPIIPIGEDVDLAPLLANMPDSADGCVFRDFVVPKGKPHSIVHAIAWSNKPASHATIVRSLGDIVGDEMKGHGPRHVIAELARGLRFSRNRREAVGYWAGEKIVADDPEDREAFRLAVALARKRKSRLGAIAACSDRYSSVNAAPAEQDATRALCLLAAREQMAIWG